MVVYSIKDIEKLTGVKAHTIRIWEKRYNIIEPKRTESNIRYYLDEDLKQILNIALLNRNGIKISKISSMDTAEIQRRVAEISDIDESFEGQLDTLTISLIDLDEVKFLKIFEKNLQEKGFVQTMTTVIYPLLDKLAMMWITGSIKSIHEKFVSNLIKRKSIVYIDRLKATRDESFLIYLPEGERNELSLLFLNYMISSHGFKVINAGVDVSIEDLVETKEIRTPEYIMTIVNDSISGENLVTYMEYISSEFPESEVILSGIQVETLPSNYTGPVITLKSSEDTMIYLEKL
jgi:DNA-binding transcriptional MerR regulator